ncbi:MAG TPA: C10 family peptidase [Opitutus sp.]|nr:C10 family peptidase [Opitutus sp.]
MPRGSEPNPFSPAAPAVRRGLRRRAACFAWAVLAVGFAAAASGAIVSRDTALRAAAGWLIRNPAPMGVAPGSAASVTTGATDAGAPLFYALNLTPTGYVVIAADDAVEPVLAFSSDSDFVAQPGTPLFDLLRRDVQTRIAAAHRRRPAASSTAPASSIRARWNQLLAERADDTGGGDEVHSLAITDVSDVCVAPMVLSHWDQTSATLEAVPPATQPMLLYIYNYYMPPYAPGTPYNYPAGCAPVAWAQIMRFHQWPKTIGYSSHVIGVDDWPYWDTMMGGDGHGGAYDWANMPLAPDRTTTLVQIKAIAALLHDAGVGTGADFTYYGTYSTTTADEIKNTFHYAEARECRPSAGLVELMKAVRTSLDAGLPANLDIFTDDNIGHSLVIDGYGYDAGTRYHHLNLGWSGHEDGWYNFPPVDVVLGDGSPEFFTVITLLKYNIDPRVAGELITGRITDANGQPVGGAAVAIDATPAQTVLTNDRGIYAFKGLAANTSYTVSATAEGFRMDTSRTSVTTGSPTETYTTPNRIVDFGATAVSVDISSPQGLDAGAPILLSVSSSSAQPAGWQRNGAPLDGTASLTLSLPNLQPADAGLYALSLSDGIDTITSALALIGIDSSTKVAGDGSEVASNIYVAANGNTFDQVLLGGPAASVKADFAERQITRISYIDLDDDIVQVELSGPGTLTLTLDEPSGPALPLKYVQDVSYMKGHAGIVITGATVDTHVAVFSVGKANAVNQALFKTDVTYDGIADLAFIAIASVDGKFGGLRAADANFFASRGVTGIYAPGVELTGPLYLGNITAFDAAKPMIRVGASTDVRITGGDLYQDNGQPVQVSGLTRVKFTDGTDSHGHLLPAKSNRATLLDHGTDITTRIVASP